MNQILKRLELIKTAISIDDEEIIDLQLVKLQNLDLDITVKNILKKLDDLDYNSALIDIDKYLIKYSGLIVYEDKEVQALKLELKKLEKKLQSLSEEKREYLNDIDEFNTLYHLKLGPLIKEILKLKKEILEKEIERKNKKYEETKALHVEMQDAHDEVQKKIKEIEVFLEDIDENDEMYEEISQVYEELKQNLKELEDELANQRDILEELENEQENKEFKEAKADYEDFSREYEQIKEENEEVLEISEDEKKEIKKLFRKASRLCHPDIVVDELKKQAHEIMQALNAAYSIKDLKTVQKILNNLEQGTAFDVTSDKIDSKDILKTKIEEIRDKIDDISKEIESIKQDEIFKTISKLDDWDEYFDELKCELEMEKERLEKKTNTPQEAIQNNNNVAQVFDNKEVIIELTNDKFLNSSVEQDMRKKLFLGHLVNPKLSIEHDATNYYDNLALKVYCNDVFIGYVVKTKQKQNIENFCFEDDKLKQLHVIFVDNMLKLIPKIVITAEENDYSTKITSIENPNFEKIRRYCQNLVDDNEADEMQKYLAENGKMYKALIYSAIETFIEKLDGETITLVDWGCDQGIVSMLVLDYLREKQLDIKVEKIVLIDNSADALGRAMLHVNTLRESEFDVMALDTNDSTEIQKLQEQIGSSANLHLIANDSVPIDLMNFDIELFNQDYFICVSGKSKKFVDDIYENLEYMMDLSVISSRESKMGKYERFERIFSVNSKEKYTPSYRSYESVWDEDPNGSTYLADGIWIKNSEKWW